MGLGLKVSHYRLIYVALCIFEIAEAVLLKRKFLDRAVVVAQLEEQPLWKPEICSSNPDIGKILSTNCTIEKLKIKKKRLGMAHL